MVFEDLQDCGLTVNENMQVNSSVLSGSTWPLSQRTSVLPSPQGCRYTSLGIINLSSIPYRTLTPKHLILLLKELLKLCW